MANKIYFLFISAIFLIIIYNTILVIDRLEFDFILKENVRIIVIF